MKTGSSNHWIVAHRRVPQGRQTQNAGWAAAAIERPGAIRQPTTAVARVGPARRQRAAECEWENEGGTTQPAMRAPGHDQRDE